MFLTKLMKSSKDEQQQQEQHPTTTSSSPLSSSSVVGVVSFISRTLGRSNSKETNKTIELAAGSTTATTTTATEGKVENSLSPALSPPPPTHNRRKPLPSPGSLSSISYTSTSKRPSLNERTFLLDGTVTAKLIDEDGKKKVLDEEEKERLKNQQTQELFNSLMEQKVYRQIMEEDRHTSDQRALHLSDSQIQEEIDLLIGKDWESKKGKQECELFRKNMRLAKIFGEKKTTQSVLPPIYATTDPPPTKFKGSFMCKVNLYFKEDTDSNLKRMVKTVHCNGEMSADDFAEFFINKLNSAYLTKRRKEEWFFKATGAAEYMYGDTRMIDFEHIRNCINKEISIELTLMDKETIEKESDPMDVHLKNVEYNFTKESNFESMDSEELHFCGDNWNSMKGISLWDLHHRKFKIKIIGADNVLPNLIHKNSSSISFKPQETLTYVMVDLYHGGLLLARSFTRSVSYSRYLRWNETIEFPLIMSDLPRETKICITIFVKPYKKEETSTTPSKDNNYKKHVPLAYVNYKLFDYNEKFLNGLRSLRMWPNEAHEPSNACVENVGLGALADDDAPCVFTYYLEEFVRPVFFPTDCVPGDLFFNSYVDYEKKQREKFKALPDDQLTAYLDKVLAESPLKLPTEEEKWRLWEARQVLKDNPKALPKVMLSVPWQCPYAVYLAHSIIPQWKEPETLDAIELLDFNYSSEHVRRYALKLLDKLPDNIFADFVLQLVQTLKYELYHDSPLSRYLLQRSLRSTHIIGHILFWHLKAEMHVPYIRERFGIILEEYLRNCGGHRRELLKQSGIVGQLYAIAMKIKVSKSEDHLKVLREELSKLKHPPKFTLPLSPKMEVKGVLIEKCKVMDSKKLPLWLVFENADDTAPPVFVMFKAGDDIRQDLLTLQMLKIMDKLWKHEGLDLHMQPYGCVCLGDMIGMIEIVLNSTTIAKITGTALQAFSDEPIYNWLKLHNTSDSEWISAVNNFALSSAGYCVATYVLGIGDRHNDNIMVTKKGDLFHIDFGHFLGNYKSFGIYKRETAPFVFTTMYAYVMGGEGSTKYIEFSENCCTAYNIIRKHGKLLINLFLLMLATGIPELRSSDDVKWIEKCLMMKGNVTDEEGSAHFREQLKKSLYNTKTNINNAFHIIAHQK